MAELNINYKVDGLDPLTQAINSLHAKLTEMGTNLGNEDNTSPSGDLGDKGKGADSPLALLAQEIQKANGSTDNLVTQIAKLADAVAKIPGTGANAGRTSSGRDAEFLRMQTEEYAQRARNQSEIKLAEVSARNQMRTEESQGRKWTGLALGAGATLAYQAGSYGATAGSAAGIINSGLVGSTDFRKQLFDKQKTNDQTLLTQALGIGIGAATLFGGPVAGLAAAGVAGIVNYKSNEATEIDKIGNANVLDQDAIAWRLGATGIARRNSHSLSVGLGLGGAAYGASTDLQELSMATDPLNNATLGAVVLGMRRDQNNRLDNAGKVQYNSNLNDLARLSGSSDVQGLGAAGAMLAAVTGKSPIDTSKGMIEEYRKYGGDTATNTGKIVQLLQQTPLNEYQATDLAYRYSANPTAMDAKVAASMSQPDEIMRRYMAAKLDPSISEQDARSMAVNGTLTPAVQKRYFDKLDHARKGTNFMTDFADPIMMFAKIFSSNNGNLYANNKGVMNSFIGPLNPRDMDYTEVMKKNQELAAEGFKNITVTNQAVTVTGSLTINGQDFMQNQTEGAPMTTPPGSYSTTGRTTETGATKKH